MNKTSTSILLVILFGLSALGKARSETITLRAKADVASGGTVNIQQDSQILQLGDKQVARIKRFYCFNETIVDLRVSDLIALRVAFDDLTTYYTHDTLFGHSSGASAGFALPEVAGPATVQLVLFKEFGSVDGSFKGGALCTIDVEGTADVVTEASAEVQTDSDSIVVPEHQGPVDIVLESSTDMKQTWQKAVPGTYGAIARKRFFRLKAALK